MKYVVDLREKMHAKILESVSHSVTKRARLKNPDVFDSKFTPTSAFLDSIVDQLRISSASLVLYRS